ncbi:MAG: peptidase C56 [Rhodospirillaceae bacterium]|jgi:protease I|nr:peptidase C56 [Rhodospirillaceae bacterium]MBT6138041.1 peptidase C56 [Rhodospirillaceae bacterium]
MNERPLTGKTIAIMVANGFEELDFTEPQKRLIAAGATVKTVSRANGLVNGWYDGAWGHFFPVDGDMADTLAIDFDGLLVPGGMRHVDKLGEDAHGARILKAFMRAGMPVALIGDAVAMLATTELAKGRTVACSDLAREALTEAGASIEDAASTVEANLVTASGTSGVEALLDSFVEVVEGYESEVNEAA